MAERRASALSRPLGRAIEGPLWSTLTVLLVSVGVGAILVTGVIAFETFEGDPTIYLVFARNLVHGYLFSFNPGHFSSGATSPLWPAYLALPVLFGPQMAKVAAIAAALVAYLVTFVVLKRFISGLGAAAGLLYLVATTTFNSVVMYETPLVHVAIAWTMVAMTGVIVNRRSRALWPWVNLALAWALLFLSRPDCAILVGASAVGVLATRAAEIKRVAIALSGAALPIIAYSSFSLVATGKVSTSEASRLQYNESNVSHLGALHYSSEAVSYLGSHWLILSVAILGLVLLAKGHRGLAVFGLIAVSGYIAVVLVGVTYSYYVERYLAPSAPFVALGIGAVVDRLRQAVCGVTTAGTYVRTGLVILTLVGSGGLARWAFVSPYRAASHESQLGYTFSQFTEVQAIRDLDRIAPPGAIVADYEVQARYAARDDLQFVSLDGLTDSCIDRFVRPADMIGFLERCRPSFWIAGGYVDYRSYMEHGILHTVYHDLLGRPVGTTVTADGIMFRSVAVRTDKVPRGSSAWWHVLVQIERPSTTSP